MFYFQNTWKHESFVTFNFTFHLKAFRKEIPSRGKIWRETDIEIKYETRFNQIFLCDIKIRIIKNLFINIVDHRNSKDIQWDFLIWI